MCAFENSLARAFFSKLHSKPYYYLYKLIIFTIYEHENICIERQNCWVGIVDINWQISTINIRFMQYSQINVLLSYKLQQ